MPLHLLTPPDSAAMYSIAAAVATTTIVSKLSENRKLDVIPTIGGSSRPGLWWAGNKSQTNIGDLILEGYEKYKSNPFKVADRNRWIVVLGGRQHIEELRKAPADTLSFLHAINDSMKFEYTMGPELIHNPYHAEIVRTRLTRNLNNLYPEIRDEISVAFSEILDLRGNEWKSVPALGTLQRVVCRASSRVFVGLPLCRDTDWINLNLQYPMDIIEAASVLRRFPDFIAPIVARFMTGPQASTERAMKHLAPIIDERLKRMEKHGKDWDGKPNDLLSWLLDEAPEGSERTVRHWTRRVLASNLAAIHTTASSFSYALFFLAENPQYMQPLRKEVEAVVGNEGWSKSSLGRMHKIDSFLKESQRLAGVASMVLIRLALKDFLFSDGTFIPKGTMVCAPGQSLHLDNEHYDNAPVFDPFRFSNSRDEGEHAKHNFVSTSPEYLSFGHGDHACPGRFFASNELKTMLAHVVVSYDIKLEDNEIRPKESRDGPCVFADPFAKIMFRRRPH